MGKETLVVLLTTGGVILTGPLALPISVNTEGGGSLSRLAGSAGGKGLDAVRTEAEVTASGVVVTGTDETDVSVGTDGADVVGTDKAWTAGALSPF